MLLKQLHVIFRAIILNRIDLHPLTDVNIIVKYADDVNLLVPENTDIYPVA